MVYKWTRLKLNSIVFFIQHEFYNSETAYSLTPLVSNIHKYGTYANKKCPKILMNYISVRIISGVVILLLQKVIQVFV